MGPAFDPVGLFPNAQEALARVGRFVVDRGLGGAEGDWSGLVREFGDGQTYLDFEAQRADRSEGRDAPLRLTFEFGVEYEGERCAVGCLVAEWQVPESSFARIGIALEYGWESSVDNVAAMLLGGVYTSLPLRVTELS